MNSWALVHGRFYSAFVLHRRHKMFYRIVDSLFWLLSVGVSGSHSVGVYRRVLGSSDLGCDRYGQCPFHMVVDHLLVAKQLGVQVS